MLVTVNASPAVQTVVTPSAEIACVANPVGAGRVYRGYAGAKDFWGDEECDLIYDAGGEGGAGQVCAAFD